MSNRKASFIISIDLELAWGVYDKINSNIIKKINEEEREICKKLLYIFDENELTVTWAVVAALLDSRSISIDKENQKAWYSPDILENILKSKTKHLIASHSYGHKEFNISNKKEIFEDFEKSKFIFEKNDIKTDVFVFPRNQVFHLDILKQFDFKTFRSVDISWYKKVYNYNKFLGKISNIIDKTFPIKTNSIRPSVNSLGLTEIPTSLLLISKNGIRSLVSNLCMFKKIKDGIDLAINRNECFHLWFHPSNFYYKSESQFELLKKVINYINLKRKEGLIEIKLLNQFN